jgi:hypothetical protein
VGEAYIVSTGLNIQQPARVRFPAVETSMSDGDRGISGDHFQK